MPRERMGRIVEEGRLPRMGRLVPMELHTELLRRGKKHGGPREGETRPAKG